METLPATAQAWVDTLAQQFAQGQLAQAYLFYGQRLSGHRAAAGALATAILAESPQNSSGFPSATTAKFVANGTHPNCFLLKPEEDKTEITAERARELNAFLQSTPTLPGWRVALIDPADSLNVAASNALLKKLEELPAKTTVILVAESLYRIKQTILSRTQKIFFPQAQTEVPSPWIRELWAQVERWVAERRMPGKEVIEALKAPEKKAELPGALQQFVADKAFQAIHGPAKDPQAARHWLEVYAALSDLIHESKDRALADSAMIQALLALLLGN